MKKFLTCLQGSFKNRVALTSFKAKKLAFLFLAICTMAGASTPWEERGLRSEVTSARSRTSVHFKNADGSISAFISPTSLHYRGSLGEWKRIDNNIRLNTAATAAIFPYLSTGNAVRTFFPANPFTGVLKMESEEGVFSEKVAAIRAVDAQGNTLAVLPLSSNVSAWFTANKITYTGFYPGLSLTYELTNDGRKFELVISSPAFFSSLPAGAKHLVVDEAFTAPSGSELTNVHGNSRLVLNGTEMFEFAQPLAYDAAGEGNSSNAGMRVSGSGGQFAISTSFSMQWLTSKARQYPLHLDPTVNYFPQNNNFWTGYQTSSTGKTTGMLRIAAAGTTSWAKFDISTLPSAAVVTGATFYGYHYTTNTVTKFAEARSMTVDPVTASAAQIYAEATAGTLYNASWLFGTTTYSWQNCPLNSAGISDLMAAKTQSWFAMGFTYQSGSTTFQYMYGYNGTNIPYLEVVYTTQPCSGTPPGNAINSPTYQICPGDDILFTLDSLYSFSGYTYQWQASTTSSVGPFVPVSGATQEQYLATNITQNTWYNLIITCTNSNGTVLVSGASATVEPTVTVTVPYYEGFESLGYNDKLPNCSWSSSAPGTNNLTYSLAPGSLNRIPNQGSGFASFYYQPAGTSYFYTNGIQLYANVTYSASIWFTTENTGDDNWTDLSLLVGSSQTPAGLQPIASTNGPAVASIYKQLDDTFSVPASGLYYIAIRASGTSGTAQYLSWDDLSVTIPCQYNPVPLSVVGPTAGVCLGKDITLTATGGSSYLWSNGSTFNSINYIPASSEYVTVVATNSVTGCTASQTRFIQVLPSPVLSTFAYPPTACAGSTVSIVAMGANTYTWNTGSNSNAITIVANAAGNYSVSGTNNFGCSAVAVQGVNVHALPVITVNAPQQICNGDQVSMSANGALSYQWFSSSSSFILQGQNVSVNPTTSTTYTVFGVDNNGCVGTQQVPMAVNDCVGLHDVGAFAFRVYPNPSSDAFTIEAAGPFSYRVTDVAGRVVMAGQGAGRSSVDASAFAAGVYYIEILQNGGSSTLKLIRQ